jgi:hypothetical protein
MWQMELIDSKKTYVAVVLITTFCVQSIFATLYLGHIHPHGLNARFILLYNRIILGCWSFGCDALSQTGCGAAVPFKAMIE